MRRHTLLVLALMLACVSAGAYFKLVAEPALYERGQRHVSDAAAIKGTFKVAGDDYLGYWPLNSADFDHRFRQRGYAVVWSNDKGNYADRHEKLARGAYDAVVLPVSTYIQHGAAYHYPAVIPAVISDSKGADAIIGYREKLVGHEERQPTVNDLNRPGLRYCFTPDSPSSFLLKTAMAHFALDHLGTKEGLQAQARTNGSRDAFNRLRRKECDVAVLWEPDLSRALEDPELVAIFGSDQVAELIVDVFAVRRQVIAERPEVVEALLRSYFESLAHYAEHRTQMHEELARASEFTSVESLDKALGRIAWFDLDANCRDWFGVGPQAGGQGQKRGNLVGTIAHATKVMVDVGDLGGDPLGGNPYQIMYSDLLKAICADGASARASVGAPANSPAVGPLSPEGWARLVPIGSLKALPITFDPSTASVTRDGALLLDQVAAELVHNYPRYRVLVKGHTAPSTDESANEALSQQRAETIRNYLERSGGIDPNRLRAVGVGAKEPLPRNAGEGDRAYRSRLARVELMLLEEK